MIGAGARLALGVGLAAAAAAWAATTAARPADVAMLAAAAGPVPVASRVPVPVAARPRALRVCADPNNMPFSNRAGEGFENRIAALVARDRGEPVEYTWWAQRRGFVRNTLAAERCDVVIGITAGDEQVVTTAPYYRSTYVFVTRRSRHLRLVSMDDPRLRRLRIGIHVIGDDYNSLPPGVALAGRGIVRNVVGYSIYGNYAQESPPSRLIAAVARGDVDVAIAWGPLAGYYAARARVPLEVTPIGTATAGHGIPFSYAIAMGVRKSDTTLRAALQHELDRRGDAIRRILHQYRVPLVNDGGGAGLEARTDAAPRAAGSAVAPHTAPGGARP